MPDTCSECNLRIGTSDEIRCLSPICPKAIDVDEVEVSEDRLNQLFGLGAYSAVAPNTCEDANNPRNDFWATSDLAPL